MSGIVGIVNADGAPVSRALLREMTEALAYRGPDARAVWTGGHVGLGHALLGTTPESASERQPLSLDGRVWITADARIDGRADLVRELESRGCGRLPGALDAELILHAYGVWGEECVDHLLGDFAFAIWDDRRQRLFGARDPFGVKLFYYAYVDGALVLGNTLDGIRMHPAVSGRLDDAAIGDFLLFGRNHDPESTTFADVKRLPGGHALTWSQGALRTHRYWTLPVDGEVRYGRAGDYVERFRELFRAAVGDRLRADRVAVHMSGGLDSTAVAATARDLLVEGGQPVALRAFTMVFDRLIPDRERHYSGLAAEGLGIPIQYRAADGYGLFDRWDRPALGRPEPVRAPLLALEADFHGEVAAHSRVALTGEDGDTLLNELAGPYFAALFRAGRVGRLLADASWYTWSERRPPPTGLRTAFQRVFGTRGVAVAFPGWLDPEFAARLGLEERWRQWQEQLRTGAPAGNPLRPRASAILSLPSMAGIFEGYDPGVTRVPVEVRHPLLDVRLVRYALSIPPVPWCVRKELLRRATRGVLPEAVRLRPKTLLAGDPVRELLRRPEARWVDEFEPAPALGRYVDRRAIPRLAGRALRPGDHTHLQPISLSLWLRQSSPVTNSVTPNPEQEAHHAAA